MHRRDTVLTAFCKSQNLGQWYCHKYGTCSAIASEGISHLLKGMADSSKEHPRKAVAVNVYSQRYYQERLKAEFDAQWEDVKSVVPSRERLAMTKEFVCDSWNKETVEFRRALQEEIDQEYDAQLEKWKKEEGTWQPTTAREYYDAVQDCLSIVAPFVDALSQRMGMYVAVLMVGPLHDGEISVASL